MIGMTTADWLLALCAPDARIINGEELMLGTSAPSGEFYDVYFVTTDGRRRFNVHRPYAALNSCLFSILRFLWFA